MNAFVFTALLFIASCSNSDKFSPAKCVDCDTGTLRDSSPQMFSRIFFGSDSPIARRKSTPARIIPPSMKQSGNQTPKASHAKVSFFNGAISNSNTEIVSDSGSESKPKIRTISHEAWVESMKTAASPSNTFLTRRSTEAAAAAFESSVSERLVHFSNSAMKPTLRARVRQEDIHDEKNDEDVADRVRTLMLNDYDQLISDISTSVNISSNFTGEDE